MAWTSLHTAPKDTPIMLMDPARGVAVKAMFEERLHPFLVDSPSGWKTLEGEIVPVSTDTLWTAAP